MQCISGVKSLSQSLNGCVLTLGNFDGVHLGHRKLIDSVLSEARTRGVPSLVYTFHPHPMQVLHPERKLSRLFDITDQIEQLDQLGVDLMVLEPFTKEFSQNPPETFLKDYLLEYLHPQCIVVGYDFHFGQNRSGDIETLKNFCKKNKIHLIQVPPFEKDKEIVSSTLIRESLKQGRIKKVNELLGRPFYLRGIVEKGFARGSQIGIPTANISFPEFLEMKTGVYATRVDLHHEKYNSVTNIGLNPTFQDAQHLKVETHIFDFSSNIYGESIRIELIEYLREEKKFSGVDELVRQIHQDIQKARALL